MTKSSSQRRIHAVTDNDAPQHFVSDAERLRLPLATVTDGKGAPRLPEPTHEALERLLGKRVDKQ